MKKPWNWQYTAQITYLWMQQRDRLILIQYHSPRSIGMSMRPYVTWMEFNTDAHAWFVTDVNSTNQHPKPFIFINSPCSVFFFISVYPSCCFFSFISCLIPLFYLCISLYPAFCPNDHALSFLPTCQVAGLGCVEPHSWQRLSKLTQCYHCVQTSRTHSREKKKNETQPPFCLSGQAGAELIRLY